MQIKWRDEEGTLKVGVSGQERLARIRVETVLQLVSEQVGLAEGLLIYCNNVPGPMAVPNSQLLHLPRLDLFTIIIPR